MKLIIFLLLFPQSILAKTYNCDLGGEQAGKIAVTLKKVPSVILTLNSKKTILKACDLAKDDFGSLIDCSHDEFDFMLLINDELKPVSGSVMSTSLELFVDLEC